jgi:tetratricopeptide (TPR) repeat protein
MLGKKLFTLILFCSWILLGLNPRLGWGNQAELEKAKALNDQVEQLYKAERYQEALPLALQALQIRERAFGSESPDNAESLNNLALIYRIMGDYEKALSLHQRALKIREKTLGSEHPDTSGSLLNLAMVYYHNMGAHDRVLPLLQRALKIWEKTLGPEYSDTAGSLKYLGGAVSSHGLL